LTDLQEKVREIREPSSPSIKKVEWSGLETSGDRSKKRLETSGDKSKKRLESSGDRNKKIILKRKNLARKTVDFRSYNVSPTAFYDFHT